MLLLLCKPKLFFALVLIVAVNISALYVISKISLREVNKKALIKKTLPCKTNKTSKSQENITDKINLHFLWGGIRPCRHYQKKDKGGRMRAIYEMIKAYLLEYIETQPIDFIVYSLLTLICACLLLLIMVVIFTHGKKEGDKGSVKKLEAGFMKQK
jgi:hypothetical protein